MKKIYKYQLGVDGQSIVINSPVKQFLHIESQYGAPMVWAMIDSTLERCKYEVMCMGTGWPLPDELIDESVYLGTALDGAGFVWHYFVRRIDD